MSNIYKDLIIFDLGRVWHPDYYRYRSDLDFKRTFILSYEENLCMIGHPNTDTHWRKIGMKLFKISQEMTR